MARVPQLKTLKRRRIVGGVDTHADTHHAAVLLMNGARVADAEFAATAAGYAQLIAWLRGFGRLHAVGVEGTGSYGAGLAGHLHAAGITVVEVSRPDRRARRLIGKSDPLDAYAAGDAVLAGRASALPKLGTGIVEAIRALHLTRASAVKARTVAINELRALLVTAPAGVRDQFRQLPTAALVDTCARLRPTPELADPIQATSQALRRLAGRHRALSEEITELDSQLRARVARACPTLLATFGVGVETAAQLLITIGDNPDRIRSEAAFAALCGVAPIPASSGKARNKHRLSRGGDRQANRALHITTITRLHRCPRTRAYATRRTAEGLSTKDILRCLKRYIAREIYNIITSINTPTKDLEPAA